MNVTKENFDTVCREMAQLLPTAAFIAIDEEMTGIHIPGVFVERMDDTTESRYQKMKTVAEHYKIIQIGLCLFHLDPSSVGSTPRYQARPYNFYLFPEEGQVNMEASAIAFNKQHKMDFNKWIYEGITYVTEEGEMKLREKFYKDAEGWTKECNRFEKQEAAANGMMIDDDSMSSSSSTPKDEKQRKPITLERESDIAFVEGVKSQIQTWLVTRTSEDKELLLPECNSFLRLAIHQWWETITNESPILSQVNADKADVYLETRPIPNQRYKNYFVLCYYSKAERVRLEREGQIKKREQFDLKLGFRRVWNSLTAARRPIVVHNGFYDLLFMWTHFENSTLPASLSEFKLRLSERFPGGIFDTKFLSNSRQFLYPWEYMNKLVARSNGASRGNNSKLTSGEEKILASFQTVSNQYNLSEISAQCRFRETHLEKLYLALKKEDELRKSGTSASSSSTVVSTPSASPSPSPSSNGSSIPPPIPHGSVTIDFVDGFMKYALIGQSGSNVDDSAAHEAGYDALMTAWIFAHFVAEAPEEELTIPLQMNGQTKTTKDATLTSTIPTPWRNRVPLYRHLSALDLTIDPATGQPNEDSLVDSTYTIYLLKGFPKEWKNEDIQAMFRSYVNQKRKMVTEGDSQGESKAESASTATTCKDDTTMVDVVDTGAASISSSPSPDIVTAPPRIIWIDDSSTFLTITKENTDKFDAYIENSLKKEDATIVPTTIEITKFAQPK